MAGNRRRVTSVESTMSWRRVVAGGLSALAIGACGDPSTSSVEPTSDTAVPGGTPDVLTVTCDRDTTSVDTAAVVAGASGVSVQLVDGSDQDLVVLMEGEDAGHALYVEGTGGHAEVAPGSYFVRCVDLDAPEHMEPPEHDLECDRRRRVEVVRGDAVVGSIHLTLGPAGWFITATEICSDP